MYMSHLLDEIVCFEKSYQYYVKWKRLFTLSGNFKFSRIGYIFMKWILNLTSCKCLHNLLIYFVKLTIVYIQYTLRVLTLYLLYNIQKNKNT